MTEGTPPSARVSLRTDPDHPDTDCRGRTYAIPFDPVWNAALEIASGGLSRWTTANADDQSGRIEARVEGLMIKMPATVRIAVTLDSNGQTRVDMTVSPDRSGTDLGAGRRRLRRFFRELDSRSGATAATILDPRSRPQTEVG